jgi:hypothetical protein
MSDTPQEPAAQETTPQKPSPSAETAAPQAGTPSEQPAISVPRPRNYLLMAGTALLVLLVVVAGYLLVKPKPSGPASTVESADDLGPGVFNPAGLRGHLITQWQGKARYQLQIEPLGPQQEKGFSAVVAAPPHPILITIRVLDSAGFALCSKDILFRYDPAKALASSTTMELAHTTKQEAAQLAKDLEARHAQIAIEQAKEADRERGADIFESSVNPDGSIRSVHALGDLPCSKDAYKRANYWDFTSNFPTLEEQDDLLNHKPDALAQLVEQAKTSTSHGKRKPAQKKQQAMFYIEGDDRIVDYDPSSARIETGMRKSFYVGRRAEQATAESWASESALIHYRCDPTANCALTRYGSPAVLHARVGQ